MIQSLEPRYLRAAIFNAASGTLEVTGTDQSDEISFSRMSAAGVDVVRLSFNGATSDFDLAKLTSIHVSAGNGSDTVILGSLKIRSVLDGGAGDDSLSGGDSRDKLIGGGGSNYLFGRGGNDLIIAGLQKDNLIGGSGDDTFIPDNTPTADDTITGGPGKDLVDYSASKIAVKASVGTNATGSQANDVIRADIEAIMGSDFADSIQNSNRHPLEMFGNGGNDTLTGGSGKDTLDGGSGNDSLLGLAGRDHFRSKDGEIDTINGGSGFDFIEDSDSFIIADSVTNI